ncbi:MAG: hypothetical protein QM640_02045 [Niabella sp.]
MTVAIKNYKAIVKALPQLIEVSGYKNDYIAKKLNMRPGYFSAKKTKGSWSLDEVEKIIETITNKDVENYLDELLIQSCFPGNTLSAADFEKKMGWK